MLARIADHKITDLAALLPWNWRHAIPVDRAAYVAAPAHAITIRRAAEMLGEDEELLWDIDTDMGPEHGCLWITTPTTGRLSPSRPMLWNTCGRCFRSTN